MKPIAPLSIVLAALSLTGCVSDTPDTTTVTGTIATSDYYTDKDSGDPACYAYDRSLAQGQGVILTDTDGQVLGQGRLGAGSDIISNSPEIPSVCAFAFTIPDIPTTLTAYNIALQSRPEQAVLLTGADLRADNWTITLTFN